MSKAQKELCLFFLGSALFLGKVFFIIGCSYYVMGTPRLGDDSFFYLSKGLGVLKNYNHGTQLQKDVKHQIAQQTIIDDKQRRQNLRVEYQAYGGPTFLYDLGMAAILKFTKNAKTAFMLSEVIIGLIMFTSISYFFISLAGVGAAGIGFILLTLLFLPGQGIHYLIPSTLTLSVGIAFIAYCSSRQNPFIAFIYSLALVMTHLMGNVWAFFGLSILIIRFLKKNNPSTLNWKEVGLLITAVLVPLLVKFILIKKTIFFSLPYQTVSLPPDIKEALIININAFIGHLLSLNRMTQVLLAVVTFNALLLLLMKKLSPREINLFFVFLSLLFISFFVWIPFIPAEVSIRVFTAIIILFVLLFSRQTVKFLHNQKNLIIGFILFSFFMFWGSKDILFYVKDNFLRKYVIESHKFVEEVRVLDKDKDTLLYLDGEYTLRQGVIAGLEGYRSYIYPLIQRQPYKEDAFSQDVPTHILFPVFSSLNTMMYARDGEFEPHGYFFDLSTLDSLSIKSKDFISDMYLLARCVKPPCDLELNNSERTQLFTFTNNQEKWIRIKLDAHAARVRVTKMNGHVIVKGVHTNELEHKKTNWPWGQFLTFEVFFNERLKVGNIKIDFSIDSIFKSQDMNVLSRVKSIQPISDSSGIVIARIIDWQ